ncbi:hypothetical protein [Nostoc piscinale]|uniref:hypothetical protein n=1 Tax=Nostoc piscinale TaxID=224012 RepID=UPI000B2600E1|nr:hypothetical protein [Nostoc piscinale]
MSINILIKSDRSWFYAGDRFLSMTFSRRTLVFIIIFTYSKSNLADCLRKTPK